MYNKNNGIIIHWEIYQFKNIKGVSIMSGERKNTITKSATANTTTKKVLSQGQADILIAIVAMTW